MPLPLYLTPSRQRRPRRQHSVPARRLAGGVARRQRDSAPAASACTSMSKSRSRQITSPQPLPSRVSRSSILAPLHGQRVPMASPMVSRRQLGPVRVTPLPQARCRSASARRSRRRISRDRRSARRRRRRRPAARRPLLLQSRGRGRRRPCEHALRDAAGAPAAAHLRPLRRRSRRRPMQKGRRSPRGAALQQTR